MEGKLAVAAYVINQILRSKRIKFLLAAIKGLRNGAVYGVKIRAPHALVMTFLFNRGHFLEKLKVIARLTFTHSRNLATFAFCYKLLMGLAEKLEGQQRQIHSFLAASAVGYFVFGEYNSVNMQINLYLLSRITIGLAKLCVKRNVVAQPKFNVFPWFAAFVWGVVLWLFEYEKDTLQPSLRSSMTYLYHDSNFWTSIRNFLFVNK